MSEEIVIYLPQHILVLPSGKIQTNFEDIVFYEKILSLAMFRPIYCSWQKPAENVACCTTLSYCIRNMWILDNSALLQHTGHFTQYTMEGI